MWTLVKESWLSLLILDQVDFRTRKITKDKEAHYVMIWGPMHEDIQCLMYAHTGTKNKSGITI